ncbi:MAG: ligase-associated DNA damage response endonuclease PdeM [Gemmatimonadaceae bacterium]
MTDTSIVTTVVAGEELELYAQRAAYWRRRKMLLVADPHFGKAASFRTLGVFVPKGTTNEAISRLDTLIARLEPAQVVFLGDFLHAKEGRNAETFDALAEWRARHASIGMQLVRGNHDKRAGDPPAEVGIVSIDGPLLAAPFAFAHHPVSVSGYYVLAGHTHPCAVLTGRARQRERLPCFWFGADVGVLPAFGDFTGCAEVETESDDTVWVVAGETVAPVIRAAM